MEFEVTLIALAGNMIVNVFLAYLYHFRVKIEEKQIQIMVDNAYATKCLIEFRKHIKIERNEILKLKDWELAEFLDELERLGE